MNRSKAVLSLAAAALSAAGVAGLGGCPSTATTTLYTPITGIVIDSQLLTAGIGCGTGSGQVYRYAAVVAEVAGSGPSPFVTSGVFDCFTDAQFSNLPTPDGGNAEYVVSIYAYDRQAFPASLGGCQNLPTSAACPGDDASVVNQVACLATWTTTCTATQVQGVSSVAICNPLMPVTTDGGPACPVAPDAGDGGDAGDAAATDGGEAGDAGDAADATQQDGGRDGAGSGEGGDGSLE